MGVVGAPDISDDLANRMSLFYANPTPMLNTLATATSRLVTEGVSLSVRPSVRLRLLYIQTILKHVYTCVYVLELTCTRGYTCTYTCNLFLFFQNPKITMENATECLSTMASVCRVINENPLELLSLSLSLSLSYCCSSSLLPSPPPSPEHTTIASRTTQRSSSV